MCQADKRILPAMSARRTDQPPKRVSFCLPNEEIASPTFSPPSNRSSPTPKTGLETPVTSTLTFNSRPEVPHNSPPPPTPQLQPPNSSSLTPKPGFPNPTRTPLRQPTAQQRFSVLSPNWPFNEKDTALIRAGYEPKWTPKPTNADWGSISTDKNQNKPANNHKPTETDSDSTSTDKDKDKSANKPKMAEPRARMARHKGQMNFQNERKSCSPCAYILQRKGINQAERKINHLIYSSSPASRLRRPKPSPKLPRRAPSRDSPRPRRNRHRLRTGTLPRCRASRTPRPPPEDQSRGLPLCAPP
jgi:hypothetical protein